MKTVTASDANRKFSKLLKEVSHGEVITVVSRGRPVATISPVNQDISIKEEARRRLFNRLRRQKAAGKRNWTREELYE